jgi:hypothetical protein
MRDLLYAFAVILIVIWAIGFFGYSTTWGAGYLIHILLVIAIIAILLRLIGGRGV